MQGLTDDGLVLEQRHPLNFAGLVDFGNQRLYRYPNGYGASVCDGEIFAFGAPFGLEVLIWLSDKKSVLTDKAPFGPLTQGDAAAINRLLADIKALPLADVDTAPQLWN